MNSSEVSEHFRYYSISFPNSNKFAKSLYLPRNRQLKSIFHQNSYLCDSIHLRSSVIIIVTAWTITDVTVAMAKRHTTLYLMWRWITQSYAYHRRTIGQMIQCCMSLYLSCLIQSSNKSGLNWSSDKKNFLFYVCCLHHRNIIRFVRFLWQFSIRHWCVGSFHCRHQIRLSHLNFT